MTANRSPLFTLKSGQTGLEIYTTQRDATPLLKTRSHMHLKQARKPWRKTQRQGCRQVASQWGFEVDPLLLCYINQPSLMMGPLSSRGANLLVEF